MPCGGHGGTALPFSSSTAIHAVMFRVTLLLLAACAIAAAVEVPETLVVDGQTYKGVVYQSHDAARLKIMHESGVANLAIADLPTEMQTKLGYDPHEAASAEKALQQQQAQARAEAKRQQLRKQIQEKALVVVGTIFQVVEGGILLESLTSNEAAKTVPHEAKKPEVRDFPNRSIGPGEFVFVMTKQSGLVDGGRYSGAIYPIGTHSFGLDGHPGSGRTLPAFSDDLAAVSKFYGLE